MPLPGLQMVTVTGRYTHPDGTAMQGTVSLEPTCGTVVSASTGATVQGTATAAFDVNGDFTLSVVATDATGINPTGFTYNVRLSFYNAPPAAFTISLPKAAPTVTLPAITPVPPAVGTYVVVTGPTGPTGPQPPLGAAGAGPTVALKSDDPSTANARTPTAHAASHATGGSDRVTPAAIGAVPATGGTVSGRLVVDAMGAPAGYPIGPTGAVASLSVPSSYAGGDDDGTGTDSTGRINLYSYQRANFNSFGENIRNFAMRADAKSMQAFYIPVQTATKTGGYDPTTRDPMASGIGWKPVVWQGAHYEANDHASIHGHWELEIADLTGALQGRLEIPFIDQATDATKTLDQAAIGVAYTNIRTNLADFSVRAQNMTAGPYSGQNTALRVGGNNSVNKELHLSIGSDMGTAGRRWIFRANNTTEAGSNAGTDFQLLRYDDAGNVLGTAVHVRRSDGNIAIGSTSVTSARITATWGTSGTHGYSALPSASPGSAAGFDAQMTATTDRAFQAALPADANRRWVLFTDGKTEWGDGTASRDTNLYRSNPGVLKTDGAVQATSSFRLNTTSLAGGVGVIAVGNATTAPASNPTGGIVMYVSGGRLKIRQPDGTDMFVALTAT